MVFTLRSLHVARNDRLPQLGSYALHASLAGLATWTVDPEPQDPWLSPFLSESAQPLGVS
jgi:hypothetical protein